jgi:formylglycine-generating enzyme required for sulfatase activity
MKKFFLLFVLFLLIFGLISCNINFLNPNDSEDNKAVPGTITTHTANTVNFNMVLSPAAKIPIKNNNSLTKTVEKAFWLGETPVTYDLWYAVKNWAKNNGYIFANLGMEGSSGSDGAPPSSSKNEPVTRISWRDAIVWSNALSEILELIPVYRYNENIIKDATDSEACDNAIQTNNFGFRLPNEWEWELAARYIGSEKPSQEPNLKEDAINLEDLWWTPGLYASGAYADYNNSEETKAVAWYSENSDIADLKKTHPVKEKRANQLGIYDMSGNVWEWCYNKDSFSTNRVLRGGDWRDTELWLALPIVNSPDTKSDRIGFRVAITFF